MMSLSSRTFGAVGHHLGAAVLSMLVLCSRASRAQDGGLANPPTVGPATEAQVPAAQPVAPGTEAPAPDFPAATPDGRAASPATQAGPPRAQAVAPDTRAVVPGTQAATPARKEPRVSIGGDLAASFENEVGSTSYILAPVLEGAFAIHPRFLLDLSWGAALMIDNQGLGEATGRLGNPLLSGIRRMQQGAWRVRGGIGVTAPVAHYPLGYDGRLYQFVYNQTLAMWGLWNQWLWLPDRMAVPATGAFEYTLPHGQALVIEAGGSPLIGVRRESGVTLVAQLATEVRLPLGYDFTFSPRLQVVLLPSTSTDRLQSALGFRLSYATSAGNFFVGSLVNLDRPLGVFGGLERWGFHVGKEIDL